MVSQPYSLTIQIPRPSDEVGRWLLTGLLIAPAIAAIVHPGLNQKADNLLAKGEFHVALPAVRLFGKQIIPSKTLFYRASPLVGSSVPTGVSTGLSDEPVKVGMTVAGFPVTSNFGKRPPPCPGCSSDHKGVDLGTPTGTPLKAFVAGTKVSCWWDSGGGGQVASIWIGPEFYQALHLSSCRNGTYGPGEVYARTGNSGSGTGAHLHWEQKIGGSKVQPKKGVLEATLTGAPPAGADLSPYLGSAGAGKDLAQFVAQWEGFRPCPYLDPVGVATIGYGTTRYPDGRAVALGNSCLTEAQAAEYKRHDLAKFNAIAKGAIARPMTPAQETAWTSFIYNVGPAGAQSTAVQRFNAGDVEGAAEALKQWDKGKVNGHMKTLPGLVNRRAEEAELLKQ
ncbi:glycoside hydrolase family protein [Nodosilinea sp. LEGE 07298]|uniref:glycoside hydrolase family protein n=1 Tax=Nodosilinea sp. LEGE 07298 TaxID=2777970 RepID=UPI0018830585|nr:glycoside hydrolase family protein [Nodosilinea sp. LEGE 07298]MBE9111823.1 glycoside hydrolase family protein [Nodosilinea sp. LEGE 07298]